MFYAVDTRTRTNEMSAEYTYFYILSPFVRLCAYTIYIRVHTAERTYIRVRCILTPTRHPLPSPRRPPPRPCTIFVVVVETTVAAEWSARARARSLARSPDDKSSSRTARPEKPQPEEYTEYCMRAYWYIPINTRDIITTLRHTPIQIYYILL